MAGTKDGGERRSKTEQGRAKARTKDATDAATGKGANPGYGTGEWARSRGLWREGDTEGPAGK